MGSRVRGPFQRHRRARTASTDEDRSSVRRPVARDRPRRGLPAARSRMRSFPIRWRVAAAFAAAMAIVLAATGVVIYARLGSDLSAALDQDLRLRAQDMSALVSDPSGSLATESGGRLIERGESFA